MDDYGSGGSIHESFKLQDLKSFDAKPTGAAVFNASQYEFFGNDVVEEVELGGLEDEDEDDFVAADDLEFLLEREEGDPLQSLSDIDDLSSTFSKLNKGVTGATSAGVNEDWGSRESLSVTERVQEAGFTNCFDQHTFNSESSRESNKWSSQPFSSSARFLESMSLHRTSSYPEQQPQHPHQHQNLQQCSSEPILTPKSVFISYPPPGGRSQQASPNSLSSHPDIPYHHGAHQKPISSPNLSPLSNHQLQLNALPHGSQFGGNLPQLPHSLPVNIRLQNRWGNQSNLYPGDPSGIPNNIPSQQPSHQNCLMPSQLMLHHHSEQTRMQLPFQPSFGHLSVSQSQQFNPHLSPSPVVMNDSDIFVLPDLRDQRAVSVLRSKLGMHYPHQGSGSGSQKGDSGWPKFKSKYMKADELENIFRMQLAATHSNEPYVDDYYHQSCLARKSAGAKLRHHFCPINLRDNSPRANASNEPHAFLQVDALGRVAFSSIRRPRPLLEVDSTNLSGNCIDESTLVEKPLEQEPMLAARVTIEDGICLLLDVDDIDRYLQFNQLQDGGAQLRQRRQVLLEDLASSLQLVDPIGKNGHAVDLAPKNDLVFLRLVSLPKGKKLLLRYIQLLLPGELTRVVCMTIVRHLRFLFGNPPVDPEASATMTNLVKSVSSCVHGMELKALAACLASVVCSVEHPPLRPIGHPAGDGASVILKSILEKATELLTDSHTASNCSSPNRAFWQASFDAFFGLLTKYCFNKYDSVMHSFLNQGSLDTTAIGPDAAKVINREMPVELLRASLPHTNEQQKKLLLQFAQRSMPVPGFSNQDRGNGGS